MKKRKEELKEISLLYTNMNKCENCANFIDKEEKKKFVKSWKKIENYILVSSLVFLGFLILIMSFYA